jgi:conjugal transfer/type IV secretion protein DotA/TraY
MNDLFQFAVGEASHGSVFYLGSIFGTVGSVLAGTGSQLLPLMFQVFNTSILALGTIILSYSAGMGILLTAHEGEILGKKYHSLWGPLRATFGLSALLPSATGYSYLQIGLMWFILQGVGAADTLWSKVSSFINADGSVAPTSEQTAFNNSNSYTEISNLFGALLCQSAMHYNDVNMPLSKVQEILKNNPSVIGNNNYYCSQYTNYISDFCQKPLNELLDIPAPTSAGASYIMGNGGCGSLQLGDPNTLVGKAQNDAYQLIVPTLGKIADQLVDMDYQYGKYLNTPATAINSPAPTIVSNYCSATSFGLNTCNIKQYQPISLNDTSVVNNLYWPYGLQPSYSDFIANANNLYIGLVYSAQIKQKMLDNALHHQSSNIANANNGWIFAGAYFINIASHNQYSNPSKMIHDHVVITQSTTNNIKLDDYPVTNALYKSSDALIQALAQSNKDTSAHDNDSYYQFFGKTPPKVRWIFDHFRTWKNSCALSILTTWQKMLANGRDNPIVSAMHTGEDLLAATENIYRFLFAIVMAAIFTGGTVMGTGWSGITLGVSAVVLPLMYSVLALLFTLAATLSLYIPMIPFVLFSFGALNWLVATIETMLAAPIIAIALVMPGGNHDIWGKAEGALMLLLNIFLRPSLMIFGLMTALALSYIAVNYINASFLYVMHSILGGYQLGLTMVLFFCIAYTVLFVAVINKCFEVIHVLPDKILRWVGGGNEQFGESAHTNERIGQQLEGGIKKTEPDLEGHTQKVSHKISTGLDRYAQSKKAEAEKNANDPRGVS